MITKPTIVIVIDSLGRGGAETLLVGILKDMSNLYNIILVTLSEVCEFKEEEIFCCSKYNVGTSGKLFFLKSAIRLRRIIKKHQPQLLHSHLLNSSLVVRIANIGLNIPLVYSLHSILSMNVFNTSWKYRLLEKFVFNKEHFVIAVSAEVLKDYEFHIGKSNHSIVITNYISDEFLYSPENKNFDFQHTPLRIVAIGNLRKVKNYEYLIEALSNIDSSIANLDIYGQGAQDYIEILEQKIKEQKSPVNLKGSSSEVRQLLLQYDAFVMSSHNEGFGIAAVEAMAMGLPLLLSDIPVLREITFDNAIFFNLNSKESFKDVIKKVKSDAHQLKKLSGNGKAIASKFYTKKVYLEKLSGLYKSMIKTNKND